MQIDADEALLENEVFGIRPGMDAWSAAPLVTSRYPPVVAEPANRAVSLGARYLASPLLAAFGLGLLVCGLMFLLGSEPFWLSSITLCVGVLLMWFSLRSWLLGVRITDDDVVVRRWTKVERFRRGSLVGFGIANYSGGLESALFWDVADHFVTLKLVRVGIENVTIETVFGSPKAVRRQAAALNAWLTEVEPSANAAGSTSR